MLWPEELQFFHHPPPNCRFHLEMEIVFQWFHFLNNLLIFSAQLGLWDENLLLRDQSTYNTNNFLLLNMSLWPTSEASQSQRGHWPAYTPRVQSECRSNGLCSTLAPDWAISIGTSWHFLRSSWSVLQPLSVFWEFQDWGHSTKPSWPACFPQECKWKSSFPLPVKLQIYTHLQYHTHPIPFLLGTEAVRAYGQSRNWTWSHKELREQGLVLHSSVSWDASGHREQQRR